jgi:hypothetical protein
MRKRPCGAERRRVVSRNSEPVQRGQPIGPRQVFAGQVSIEFPRLAAGDGRMSGRHTALGRQHQLACFIPGERGLEVLGRHDFQDQCACRDVQRSEPRRRAAGVEGKHVVVAVFDQPVVGEHGPGRNGFDHSAPHDTLGEFWVFDLLGDRDAVSLRDEAAQVFGGGLDGDAGQGDFGRAAIVARGERQA